MKNSKSFKMRKQSFIITGIFLVIALFYGLSLSVSASSGYPYLIKVNRRKSTVTVYKKDAKGQYTKPVKAMLCSPGYQTPIGTYHTKAKYRWKLLMGDVWGQYSTRIVGGVLFHSVWYYKPDPATLSNRQFNKLGTICSHGCVRLSTVDAKWIYDNCSVGTTVVIYDSNDPGPLGKPNSVKVSASSLMGYDPTDIWSAGNPYLKKKPVIDGVSDCSYKYGTKTVNLKKGVRALSFEGTNITKKIKLSILYHGKTVKNINTKKSGDYYVTYSVTDAFGNKATKSVVVTVKLTDEKPVLSGVIKRRVVAPDMNVTKAFVIKNVKAVWNKKVLPASEIHVKINQSGSVYKVTYSVTAPNKKKATAVAKVICDKQAPVLRGVKDHEISWETEVTKEYVLKSVSVKDKYCKVKKKDIDVVIEQVSDIKYNVTYTVSDRYGNEAEKKAVYEVTDFLKFDMSQSFSFNGKIVNRDSVLASGIKAYDGEKEITDSMSVFFEKGENGNYYVLLIIQDEKGHQKRKRVLFEA